MYNLQKLATALNMWQSRVEIEHYSVVHFNHVTTNHEKQIVGDKVGFSALGDGE